MIEIFMLFLGVCGALSAPNALHLDSEFDSFENDAEVIESQLPGTGNLNEKSLPVARLYTVETENLPGSANLEEKSQIPQLARTPLPGTKNLAEKSIPDYVIRRMSDPNIVRVSSDPDFPNIPIQ